MSNSVPAAAERREGGERPEEIACNEILLSGLKSRIRWKCQGLLYAYIYIYTYIYIHTNTIGKNLASSSDFYSIAGGAEEFC